jgi:hypothetical protein
VPFDPGCRDDVALDERGDQGIEIPDGIEFGRHVQFRPSAAIR